MELVSCYRDRMIEFSEAMAQWYRCFQTTRRGRKEPHSDFWGYDFPRYHMDRSPYWILHLLDCAAPPPAAIPRLEQAGVDPSELLSSDGESVLMVTDASGLPLGFDVLAGGWAGSLGGGEAAGGDGKGALETIQKMVGLLRHCMEAPMTGGLPRRPHMLHVNDKKLHSDWEECFYTMVSSEGRRPGMLKTSPPPVQPPWRQSQGLGQNIIQNWMRPSQTCHTLED
ncbi:uncharacterized protein [Salvelinus sp. IW2-2015]|uniref:uncharacterized protein n=1 Tax=Salvelinus sp. IW2-2015 TaxID=2691554 RepID=UPI000CEADE09|nr:uncharacterized protein LOC112072198 [Salvelinus alpinus]